ncbi:hypothetical protein MSIMFB_02057 [Mycobacterium simulans]|uniref:Lipoprotein n=1 Tax=Mycobacterium simulans TaxID=627089 RepID=A0A7Z7N9B5_9MYCO|nr:hypothetical protein [Mycobacterium simulans]SOJ54567.1 hypothetical protein MSIMFB_02057 [Mycobacterium simulans]
MAFTTDLTATVMAACLVAATASACSTSTAAVRPTTADPIALVTITQPELLRDFVAEQDPMGVVTKGVYTFLRQPTTSGVAITGYRSEVAADGTTSKIATFAYNPAAGTYSRVPYRELVWSPRQATWVEIDPIETLSPGPTGSRGWPTVKSVAEFGTSYYTFSYDDLGGQALQDGLEAGFAEGVALPQSVQAGKFSPGARVYLRTETTVDPFYTIHRVKIGNTGTEHLLPVYACGKPSSECRTPATSLVIADQQGGQFTNFAGTVRLELGGDGHARLRPVETPDMSFANLTYRIAETDGPKRITFQASTPDDADKFGKAIGITLDRFALFEYDGLVTIGFAEPANSTTTTIGGYNRIAANDLLTQWTPPLPAVLS